MKVTGEQFNQLQKILNLSRRSHPRTAEMIRMGKFLHNCRWSADKRDQAPLHSRNRRGNRWNTDVLPGRLLGCRNSPGTLCTRILDVRIGGFLAVDFTLALAVEQG